MNDEGKTRRCGTCKAVLPVFNFTKGTWTCKPCAAEKMRARRAADPEKAKAQRRAHYLKNKDRVLAQAAVYQAAHKVEEKASRRAHYLRNRDHVLAYSKAYRLSNLEMYRNATARRRAQLRNAQPVWADPDAIARIYAEAVRATAETGEMWEVDHIVPLQGKTVCGLHCEANLQVVPAAVNRAKYNTIWPDM